MLQVKFASLVDVCHPYHNARTLTKQLPWHYVGMMLHHSENHLISLFETGAERCRHKINSLGSATGENNLLYRIGIYIVPQFLAAFFLQVSHLLRQSVYATMHIRLAVGVDALNLIHHTRRSLRSGRVVKINQWLAGHLS